MLKPDTHELNSPQALAIEIFGTTKNPSKLHESFLAQPEIDRK